MHIRHFHLFVFLFVLACSLLPSAPTYAQTQPVSQPAPQRQNYQAAFLDDSILNAGFAGKSYILRESDRHLDIRTIEDMVRSGDMLSYLNRESHINLGSDGKGMWIVLPVVNNGNRDTWTLNLGSFGTGRFDSLKDILIHRMGSAQTVLNTMNASERTTNLPRVLQLKIPAKQTSFFILYLKPNIAGFSFISPTLESSNQKSFSQLLSSWLTIILGFGAFLYFIKSPNDKESRADLYMGLIWLGTSVQLLFTSNFLYIGQFGTEFISPLIWIFISMMMMLSLISLEDCREKIPTSLFAGLTSVLLILGLAGIITLRVFPETAIYLIYMPIFLICLMVAGLSCFLVLKERQQTYLPLTCAGACISATIFWIGFLYFGMLPATTGTTAIPQILLTLSIITSVASTMLPALRYEAEEDTGIDDIFADNNLSKKDVAEILDAKEQSEHRRLIQVIEQERQLMSELQVKSAQQNEEMRRSKEAADEANRAKSAFLAVVSHEIRTPMTGIMGMLRLLQDTQLSKEQKEYAMTIKDSGDAMLALLNDILDFEKIESGKMDLEDISFDLKRLIKGVHTLMRGHAEAKNINIVLDIDDNTPTWVRGDPTRLRQVLLNLINNAIKFTSKGNIYLRVRDLTGDADNKFSKSHQIYFAIQDSGVGISPEAQKKLFMPFAQADSSISRKYGGTGLGLAICKRLIEAMGGAISINSKENEGSTFFFTLSMVEGHAVSENETFNPPDSARSMSDSKFKSSAHILVVDDNGINLKVVAGFIEKLGATCMTASSGADALEVLAGNQFDLILMDLQLPDMSGIEVTHRIRSLPVDTKSSIPIVALTGNTDGDDKKACFDAGMNDFATKPITFEKISELLQKVNSGVYSDPSYLSRPAVLDFVTPENESDEPQQNDDSQQTIAEDDILLSDANTDFIADENFDLGDDEDSFALAVKKFEEIENAGPWTANSSKANSEIQSLADVGLDESLLKSLRDGLSVEQIQEILISFYEKADELIADIGNTYLSGDAINLYARAHELKGMAGNFGFSELSKMCATIEKAAKENALAPAKEPIEHLGEHYAVARTALNQWLTQK